MTAVRYEAADSRETEARRLALRRELHALIRSWNPAVTPDLDDHSSLIASGVIDSLSLFNLILWIEAKSGRTIDPAAIDVTRDWDTIAAILRYLDPSPEHVRGDGSEPVKTTMRQSRRYRIVGYRPEFKRAVANFQTGLWSPDPVKNLRYLEWKYEDNPYSDPGRIYLAFDDEELVGMRGFYPSCWEIGRPGRCVRLLVADDLLVSEQHRNQGLVGEIMSAARDDLRGQGERYVINLSGGTLTVLESLATGWRATGMLRPMSRHSSAGSLYTKLGRLFTRVTHAAHVDNSHDAGSFSRLDRTPRPYRADAGMYVEIDSRPRIAEMVDLIERIGYDGRLRHLRDRDYLEWRYRNPFREYRFLYCAEDALNGFLVLRRAIDRIPPRRQVSIVDLEAINDQVACALLETAVHAGSFEELEAWAATMSAPAITHLGRLGFRPARSQLTAPGTPYLLVWSLGGSEDDQWDLEGLNLLDLHSWDVRTIYSMFG